MKVKFLLPLLILFSVALVASLTPGEKVLHVGDRKDVPFQRMMGEVSKADIIFVGEVHDIEEHHRNELEVIRALHEADVPLVVGLEMFRSDSDKVLDDWVKGGLPLSRFLPAYYDNWQQGWPLYRDIFFYAREHQIPMIGLNIPDDISQTVGRGGFAALSPAQKKLLPPGISCSVDPTYMEFIKKAYAGHAAKMDKKFLNFCEAQMVWDKSMAWHIVTYLKKNPGRTMVVLAGVGHAWKRGIPGQLAGLSRYTFKVLLPLIPDQIEPGSVTVKDADYIFLE